MLVQIDVHDPHEVAPSRCPSCDAFLPVRVTNFEQSWYVGQVCLRCCKPGWVLGVFDAPDIAQGILASFLVEALQRGNAAAVPRLLRPLNL